MKSLMIIGAVIGFGTSTVLGLLCQSDWTGILGRGSVAALGAGWMMRWWGRTWLKELRTALEQRQREQEALEAAQSKEAKTTSPVRV